MIVKQTVGYALIAKYAWARNNNASLKLSKT